VNKFLAGRGTRAQMQDEKRSLKLLRRCMLWNERMQRLFDACMIENAVRPYSSKKVSKAAHPTNMLLPSSIHKKYRFLLKFLHSCYYVFVLLYFQEKTHLLFGLLAQKR
jgi:hypothetical protein